MQYLLKISLIATLLLVLNTTSNAQKDGKIGFVTNEVMDANDFWKIIERSKKSEDIFKQKNSLIKILKREDIKEIVKFNNRFFSLMDIAFDSKLMASMSIVNNDCDEECFLYFRAWLILQGKEIFEKVIVNPDEMASLLISNDFEKAELQFCADDAFYYLVNEHIPLGIKISNMPHGNVIPKDKFELYFPKLSAKYKQ